MSTSWQLAKRTAALASTLTPLTKWKFFKPLERKFGVLTTSPRRAELQESARGKRSDTGTRKRAYYLLRRGGAGQAVSNHNRHVLYNSVIAGSAPDKSNDTNRQVRWKGGGKPSATGRMGGGEGGIQKGRRGWSDEGMRVLLLSSIDLLQSGMAGRVMKCGIWGCPRALVWAL